MIPAVLHRRQTLVAAWLTLVPSVIVAAVVAAPPHSSLNPVAEPSGYELIVRDVFVREGILRLPQEPRALGERVVEVDVQKLRDKGNGALRRFYVNSSLRSDVERNDPSLWDVGAGQDQQTPTALRGVAANSHAVSSLFAPGEWRGDLIFGGTRDGGRSLEFDAGNGKTTRVAMSDSTALVRSACTVRIYAPDPNMSACSKIQLAATREPLATLYAAAGHVWIRADSEDVVVDDSPLGQGKGRLLIGDTRVSIGRVIFDIREHQAILSEWNGAGIRYRDPGYRQLSIAVEDALNIAMSRCRSNCNLSTRPFELTLDKTLNDYAKQRLDELTGSDRFPAAVTIMNAMTGDILALASHDPAIDQDASWRYNPVNYNFKLLAVGSTAKPLISAAILAKYPDYRLLSFRNINDGESASELLGIDLAGSTIGTRDGANGPWITYRDFLKYSSNLYAADLMTMALEPDWTKPGQPAAGSYAFAGWATQPDPPLLQLDVSGGAAPLLTQNPTWWRYLEALYDIGNNQAGSVWRNLPQSALQAGSGQHERYFSGLSAVTPETRDWPLSGPKLQLRDYVTMILGGEAFKWSTVDLAEGYSRLVTRTRVRARMVASGNERYAADTLLGDTSRATICDGLAAVLEPGGTGASLKALLDAAARIDGQAAAAGALVRILSKTGTPQMDRMYPRDETMLRYEEGFLGGTIISRANKLAVAAGSVTYLPQREEDLPAVQAALAGQPAALAIHDPADRREIVRRTARHMLEYNQDRNQAFVLVNGRPDRMARNGPFHKEHGHLYVFVVVVYNQRDADWRGCSRSPDAAFTVAINLQADRGDAEVAKRIAAKLLDPNSPLTRRILDAAKVPGSAR